MKLLILGFALLRQPVPIIQEPDHNGSERNGHLKGFLYIKKSFPVLLLSLLSTAWQQLPLPQNSGCLIPGCQ